MEVVREQVKVGGGWVEVVVDRDAQAVDVSPAVRAGDVPLGGGDLPQGLGDTELVTILTSDTPAPAEDRPHDGEDDEECEEDALDDDQLPGGVNVGPGKLLILPVQPMPVEHFPECVQVEVLEVTSGRLRSGCVDAVHDDGACGLF